MRTFDSKVIAITGAASGIGRALAVELARHGAHVAMSDVDRDGLDETAALVDDAGHEPHVADVDVAQREAVEDWANTVAAHFGAAHGIVNNAGVSLRCTVEEMSYEDFEWLMNINFWGVVYGTKAFLPHIRRAGGGNIVNISSVFGIIGVPTQSAYNAAKFAVRGFTESLRTEMLLEDAPVGVTCVHPGGVKTNIVRNGRIHDLTRFEDVVDLVDDFDQRLARTTPESAARTIVEGMRHDRPRVLVGLDAVLIDRAQRNLPAAYQYFVSRVYRRTVTER